MHDRVILRSPLAVALCAIALGACAQHPAAPSASPATPMAPAKVAGYLDGAELPDAIAFLRPPPAGDSVARRHDDDSAAAALALRGGARYALAAEDAEYRMPAAAASFECALGVTLDPTRAPATLRLLDRVREDTSEASAAVKKHYGRERPFMVNGAATCKPADDTFLRTNGAYPSGHAMLGWMWALALADAMPERAQALLGRGRDYGESRVVCNVHWRSDVLAARDLADLVAARERASSDYHRDVVAARREIRRLASSGATPARDCAAEAAALAAPALPAQ